MSDPGRWREPSALIPLTWGNYADRYVVGLVLIIGGGIHLLGANTWTLALLLVGSLAEIVGWCILPSKGRRRLVATAPAVIASWVMLTGPQAASVLVLAYLGWLVVRHRPARSYLTVLFPLANGFIIPRLFTDYSGMLPAIAISLAVLVASAWLARLIAASAPPSSQSPAIIG